MNQIIPGPCTVLNTVVVEFYYNGNPVVITPSEGRLVKVTHGTVLPIQAAELIPKHYRQQLVVIVSYH